MRGDEHSLEGCENPAPCSCSRAGAAETIRKLARALGTSPPCRGKLGFVLQQKGRFGKERLGSCGGGEACGGPGWRLEGTGIAGRPAALQESPEQPGVAEGRRGAALAVPSPGGSSPGPGGRGRSVRPALPSLPGRRAASITSCRRLHEEGTAVPTLSPRQDCASGIRPRGGNGQPGRPGLLPAGLGQEGRRAARPGVAEEEIWYWKWNAVVLSSPGGLWEAGRHSRAPMGCLARGCAVL